MPLYDKAAPRATPASIAGVLAGGGRGGQPPGNPSRAFLPPFSFVAKMAGHAYAYIYGSESEQYTVHGF